jgi:hypothetical protein
MKRRHFLQFSSSLLASLGMSQLDLIHQANRYAQVLAQSTPRKLALLVGINDYEPALGSLQGCLTDVEMQRELLIHRFGFNSNDILTLTNAQASREGILKAFEEHLIKQAKPGDVVIFHYSGHGSRVLDPDPIGGDKFNSTMVPSDRPAQSVTSADTPVPDIMGHSLFLLMSAVQTENMTVVLDSCYSGGGKRGNVAVRAARLDSGVSLDPSPQELEYQTQWRSKLFPSKEDYLASRLKGVAKGVVIASARSDQIATDGTFDGFHAGAFTYLLTRYLWQEPGNEPLKMVFVNLARRTKDIGQSNPNVDVKPGSDHDSQPLYLVQKTRPAAEAVIQEVNDKQVKLWLGGVASESLKAFDAATFTVIDDEGRELGLVKQTSRNGLVGSGTISSNTQSGVVRPGHLLREQVRGIPPNLTLRVGVDDTLGAEKSQARAALQGQKRIEPISVDQKSNADYLFGRVIQEDFQSWQKQQVSNPPPVGSLGLFTPGRVPVPDSFGQAGESVEQAMQRLRAKLKSLLAVRILQTIINGDSSKLNVAISVKALDGTGASGSIKSRGTKNAQSTLPSGVSNSQTQAFKPGTAIQIQVQNNESHNLYFSALVIDSSGNITILFPFWDAPEERALVAPQTTLTIPEGGVRFRLKEETGTFEMLVLASTKSLRSALRGLKDIATNQKRGRGTPMTLHEDESVDVMEKLLGDLDNHARSAGVTIEGVQEVDTAQFAAISSIIEVVS